MYHYKAVNLALINGYVQEGVGGGVGGGGGGKGTRGGKVNFTFQRHKPASDNFINIE